jgi:hypothetical protein
MAATRAETQAEHPDRRAAVAIASLRGAAAPPALPAPPRRTSEPVIRVVRNLLLLGALALLAVPSAAQAADPVLDCARDNDLDRSYTRSELKNALDNLPTDSDEYGLCREVISGAIHSGSDKGGGRPEASGSNGEGVSSKEQGSREKDAEELSAIAGDTGGDPAAPTVDVGGETVSPNDDGIFDLASASNDLPTPVLVALIAIGLLAIAGVLVALRSRIPALARVPVLSKIPTPRVPFPRSSRR